MSDIPQLEQMLVAAAGRHGRRRRRVARAGAAAAVVVLVLAAAAAVAQLGDPDREVAVDPPAAKKDFDAAYAVFRRPERRSDRLPGARGPRGARFDRIRLIARTPTLRIYLARRGSEACLVERVVRGPVGGMGCGRASAYVDGHTPIGTFSDEKGPSTIAFAFPDGVKAVRLTLEDGTVAEYPVRANGFARDVKRRAARLEWTAPDGTKQMQTFAPAPAFRAEDFYGVLKRPATPADVLRDLPGARLIASHDGVRAWLVPRLGAVCLVVHDGNREVGGCRHKVADVRRPLIVAIGPEDRSRRTIVAAFPDIIKRVRIDRRDPDRTSLRRTTGNVVVIEEAADVVAVRYRVERQESTIQGLPASTWSYVANARAEPPERVAAP
jgi:hypothetical protein